MKKAKKKDGDLSSYVFGRVQPQALPLEEAVLGAIMLDKDALDIVIQILTPKMFYIEAHQLIFAAYIRLFEKSVPIDLLITNEELKKTGDLQKVGGPYYLVGLTNRVASAANVEYHARIIVQKYLRRKVIQFCTQSIQDAYNDEMDVFELIDKIGTNYTDTIEEFSNRNSEPIANLVNAYLKQVEAASNQKEGLTGVPSGYTELDRMTAGWQSSDLIIIAARPGMGKTAAAMLMGKNAAEMGKPGAFFSLEMSKLQLLGRLVSAEAEINGQKLKKGQLEDYEWQKMQEAIERLAELPIEIDDTPGLTIHELRAKCRKLKMQKDIQWVVIDYLQLMSGDGKAINREQEISKISRGLKLLAKELNIPVIALSQLSRAVETRGGTKRPQLSDLRDSGAVEQDADLVSFIYRAEYYKIFEDEEGQSLKGIGEFIVAKHRNGPLGTIKLKFIDKYAKFTDLDDLGFNDTVSENDDLRITPELNPFSNEFDETKAIAALNQNTEVQFLRPSEDDLKNMM